MVEHEVVLGVPQASDAKPEDSLELPAADPAPPLPLACVQHGGFVGRFLLDADHPGARDGGHHGARPHNGGARRGVLHHAVPAGDGRGGARGRPVRHRAARAGALDLLQHRDPRQPAALRHGAGAADAAPLLARAVHDGQVGVRAWHHGERRRHIGALHPRAAAPRCGGLANFLHRHSVVAAGVASRQGPWADVRLALLAEVPRVGRPPQRLPGPHQLRARRGGHARLPGVARQEDRRGGPDHAQGVRSRGRQVRQHHRGRPNGA
mmetsp:Transcript_69423/g.212812  ORF Transcript_69423/g.212812 Transcript_69423/m.212812 type:complete len:265 (-) Transcript_69423:72-866(-)